MGIEADIILLHPYDEGRWGFDRMPDEVDDRYLKYVVTRLAPYRNVWWSLANEYDFMTEKEESDWDRMIQVVHDADVGRAKRVWADSLDADVLRRPALLPGHRRRRVETFDVTDLKNRAMSLGEFDHLLGLLEVCGKRLLDQDRNSTLQKLGSNGAVCKRRNDDRDGVDLPI